MKYSEREISVRVRLIALAEARENYLFSLRIWHLAVEEKLPLSLFQEEITFAEGGSQIFSSSSELNSNQKLIQRAEVATQSAIGSFVAAIYELARCIPEPRNDADETMRILAVAIRNCFAHSIGDPIWTIKEKHARLLKAGDLRIDLRGLNGERFQYEHLGGVGTLQLLCDNVRDRVMAFYQISEQDLEGIL